MRCAVSSQDIQTGSFSDPILLNHPTLKIKGQKTGLWAKQNISLQARLFAFALKILKMRSRFRRMIRNPPRSRRSFLPPYLSKSYKVDTLNISSKMAVTFEKRGQVNNRHIIYLHGGAWMFEALKPHWNLAKEILDGSHCRMTMVDYPLAPEAHYKETLLMLENCYSILKEKYEEDSFILMGDSAGGNIALAFTQKLILEEITTLPSRLILFSPCVDLTFTNPDIKKLEPLDFILSEDLVKFGANNYANGDNLEQHLLSPVNGDLHKLPETDIFYGTHEILMPDILRFKAKAEESGASISFHEYEAMQHDWVLFPIPERQEVIHKVIGILDAMN